MKVCKTVAWKFELMRRLSKGKDLSSREAERRIHRCKLAQRLQDT